MKPEMLDSRELNGGPRRKMDQYQVDIFDEFGAILIRATFQTCFRALTWMIEFGTGESLREWGHKIEEATHWELTRMDGA
jgi:hypothetical protein